MSACRSPLIRFAFVFWLAGLLICGCTKFDLLNATVPACGYVRTSNLAYGSRPRQKLDVYRPTRAAGDGRVVIFFYGGDWQNGSKTDYRFVAQALASKGFIAVMPDYRLYPSVTFPAFVDDGALAVRWARDNVAQFGGDPSRIDLMGHSAGAYIAAMLTLDPRYLAHVGLTRQSIRATAALSGPYNFTPSSGDLAAFSMKAGEAPSPDMEPIHFVDGREPPMLLIQGLKDRTVDPSNALQLAQRISAAGGKVRLITYPDRAHVGVVLSLAASFRWLAPTLEDVSNYFREH
jgi:acetyl esterase/lipase